MNKTKKFSRTPRPKYTPKKNPTAEIGVTDKNTGATYTTAIKNKTRKLRPTPGFNNPKYIDPIDPVRTIRNTIRNVKSPNSPFFPYGTSVREPKKPNLFFRNVPGEGVQLKLQKRGGSKRKTRKRKRKMKK
jgi:hypothetical protein